MPGMVPPALNQDPVAQMNTYRSFVSMLVDPTAKDESKLKAAQELSEDLGTIIASPQYSSFLEHAMRIFLKILQEGEPQFIAESNSQQLRKLILEILHRLPTNDSLKPYVKQILSLMFRLLEIENEENVLVCLRIIIELHKHLRPQFSAEIQHFLEFLKNIYKELPNHLNKIFEPHQTLKVKDISELNIDLLLLEIYTTTNVQTEKKNPDGSPISYNIIPKAVLSLKVLAELPIIVVLMYQLYKQSVHQDVAEFIPLIMNTIIMQPPTQLRASPNFNKEVYVDFMAAQIKTLSFLAYIIRIYQDTVNAHAPQLVKGMLGLFMLCPQEVAHLRKELLIAARHILATELRLKFVTCIDQLFDESILIGSGWTVYETLRPLAYSTLADLVHHVRQHLPLKDLAAAATVFSKNVHDESLPTSIQTMSCKLLLNLVECIRTKSELENGNGRELLMRMLEVFVLKFKTIARLQLPTLMQKCRQQILGNASTSSSSLTSSSSMPATPSTPLPGVMQSPSFTSPVSVSAVVGATTPSTPAADPKPESKDESKFTGFSVTGIMDSKDEKPKFGFPSSQANNYTLADCRSLVKTLIGGAKTITWGISSCKLPGDAAVTQHKQFQPKETLVFIRLVRYALQALDIYTLTAPTPGQSQIRSSPMQTVRSKEEKEVLEHLAGVFTMMNPLTFEVVFSTTIDYVVERINSNFALQIVANSFLANPGTSRIFATILVEYLLERMEEMGSNMERSNLYLKLFKLVFGSVSLFPSDNEQMLKPHLHQIVNKSLELALSAKEPYNYFLLLRALFRSIGGGSHDLLYQEFLPLLPSLLQGLNSLQSGLHKQHMKDLFVELCLTVPVRLSSLLPYLPMLMDPLVSALNGSQTLVSQGLRTLELCVDNLQPDFLYDHIQPVRAELMQALWRTLRNPADNVAQVAFRVLGKFGGGNRKMMTEPQKLEYNDREGCGPCITVYFQEHKTPIALPVEKVIETAFNALKASTTDPFYRKQCWEVVKGFLVANIQQDDDLHKLQQLLTHPSFGSGEIYPLQGPFYKCPDSDTRKVHEMALTGMFVAAAIKELRSVVLPFMVALVRHYTMVAISQQCGPFSSTGRQNKLQGMDPLVLIDAVAAIMGHEEKELCKPGHLALIIILETATMVLTNKERACQIPLMEYLVERMCSLCYDRAWYAKLGGCIAIKFLFEKMTLKWVMMHQYVFLRALLFVMMDLTGEVSSGAVDMAKSNLEKMLILCGTPIMPDGTNGDLVEAQRKSLHEVTQELVRQVTSPNTCVREQAMHSLEVLARISNKSVTEIMEPHKDVLADMIPPKKHLLRHQPANAQIGIMDGNTFCTTLEPRLFTIYLNITEHKVFFTELINLCDAEDAALMKLSCYKAVSNLIPLRKSALRALAACHYIPQGKDRIFNIIFKALNSNNEELQETGFECMKKFIAKAELNMELVHMSMRSLLTMLGSYRQLNLNVLKRLSYLIQLFPNSFNEKLCDQLLAHLLKWLDTIVAATRNQQNTTNEMKLCAAIVNTYHQLPAASSRYVEPLIAAILKIERALMIEAGSIFREPLIKFLQRHPNHTIDLLLNETNTVDEQVCRLLESILKGESGKPFREVLQQNPTRLLNMALSGLQPSSQQPIQPQSPSQVPSPLQTPSGIVGLPSPSAAVPGLAAPTHHVKYDLQYQAIRIVSILVKYDDTSLSGQQQLVACLRRIWISEEFQERHRKADSIDYTKWKEPKLLAKCLLNYVKHHPNEVELLFQLLRGFTGRFIPDFEFLRDFLENTVANNYTVDWKRLAFFKFVEVFHDSMFPQDLKSKILQYIIIPAFAVAFERGEGERIIGGPPSPEQDLPDNVISVFINKVIDPDNPFGMSDSVRILLLQFSCLLVEQASPHIHDAANKRQGNKLRRLMTFAWPCLLVKNCVDPATKYHGHLLLAHIIAKFAIHKRIVLQVFHSLLKAHAVEARTVVRQALEILTPAMPARMEDGNTMLTHWTKKIIVEEGHTLAQLVHMLQLLVRHYKVYYPVRHHLIQHMMSSVQRLGFTANASIDHKKLAVDLAEVIIRWEIQRQKEDQEQMSLTDVIVESTVQPIASTSALKRTGSGDSLQEMRRVRTPSGVNPRVSPDNNKPVDKVHADGVVNFLLRMACQVNETATTVGSPGEMLSRRCVALLKTALKPDVWPTAELKLTWFDKLLTTVETTQPNFGNICTALELLAFLLTILRKETILSSFRPLQRGIAACMTCNNSKVIRSVHNLLSRLMSIFPTEPTTSNVTSKHEELECLYASVSKVVYEGLTTYEKATNASPSSLFSTLMILKAACVNNPCYIDRLITTFMRVLQKMTREHLNPTTQENNPMATELLILSLDLVKNRVGVMGQEMRKGFIGTILVGLIEKSPDVKVLKAITKMVEDWVKNKNPIAVNQSPILREKSILLVKMMQFIEKRFPDDLELNAQFLELVNYVYRDDTLKASELASKLEPAFMAGLRCVQPHIRAKFFEVFDSSMRRRLHERLMYICYSQNWDTIGAHFWIKQCIELILVTAMSGTTIQNPASEKLLPSITNVINQANSQERASFVMAACVKEEPTDVESVEKEEEEIDIELSTDDGHSKLTGGEGSSVSLGLGSHGRVEGSDPRQNLNVILSKQAKFLEGLREVKTINFLMATAQLCHLDSNLAQHLWIKLFPRLWSILSEKQHNALGAELVPFVSSGSHLQQKDCHPSALGTFVEALSQCVPSVAIHSLVLRYIGKSHNIWHRSILILEQMAFEKGVGPQVKSRSSAAADCYDFEPVTTPHHETLDILCDMYATLKEEDLWAGLWQKRAKYPETSLSVAYEQQGFYEQAQGAYELAMGKARQDFNTTPAPVSSQSEVMLWEKHWIRCSEELNQWDLVLEYGTSTSSDDPFLVLESAWRVPNWTLMKEALSQVESNYPKEISWKVNLYKGYISICHPDDHHLNVVERVVEVCTNMCIKEWRRLPHVVSHIHLPLLQAAQQIMELQEAAQIHLGLSPQNIGRTNSLHDMKAIVKTWRNRLPVLSDDLSHWSDIFTWRQHHYQAIVSHYDGNQGIQHDPQTGQAMLGVHASAQSIIHYGKIARKHGLTGVCLDSLNRIHTIPSVPIVDCFQKIRQQVKCYLQMSSIMGKNELQEGLEVIESTNLKYFTKEMTAELYSLKGVFLTQLGRSEEANKAFSSAVQLHDTLVNAWALWGDYLEQIFTRDRWESRQINLGVSTLVCYLHACRHQNENKSRKYLAKVLWLLTYDDERGSLAEAVDKYNVGVPPMQWLPWIPQLLTCLVRNEGRLILNLLSQVARVYPQAVYFPIRTLYLTLKIEQRERYKSGELANAADSRRATTGSLASQTVSALLSGSPNPPSPAASSDAAHLSAVAGSSSPCPSDAQQQGQMAGQQQGQVGGQQQGQVGGQPNQQPPPQQPGETGPIRATAPMWRCSRIMHMQRDLHPTILSSLEGIVDQMVWFRENWYEEVLRQLRQGLAKCYAVAFENRGNVSEATVTPHTLNFVKKLVSTFGVGIENVSSVSTTFSSAASESLARRAQATAQDPVFQKMKSQFTADFDFSVPGAMKLHNLISKLKKWIKILEAKTKLLPKSFLIEEKCRFLSNFTQQTAEVELPGEFLLPKHNHYCVRIAKFMPRVEIVQKHNTAARRLFIRGHNGKIYPYLVVNDSCMSDGRREERVLQLMRMLNHYLLKQKETAKRFLSFTVPRVVPVSPQMRLIEDNPASISLLDIYKQRCAKREIEHDAPLARYYERLATVQARGSQASHQVLRDILRDVQAIMVPKAMLKEWALSTYLDATDLWTFRKQFTLQLSLSGFAEFVLHLTRLNPDMMYIHQDCGLMNVSYFRFDVDDVTGELDANRPVPFRLTPNISEFITAIGVSGPMTASMIAVARCLIQPNLKVQALLRAILRDEMMAWHKKRQEDTLQPGASPQDMEGELLISMVTKAVNAIMTRLQNLANFEGVDSKVSTLVAAANSHDNLCRMDPAWHPWL